MRNALTVAIALVASSSAWAQTTYTDTANPTSTEQLILEIINRARANPPIEGARLASVPPPMGPLPLGDITEGISNKSWVVAKPPLAMNAQLYAAAQQHSTEMWTDAYFDHTGTGGTTPGSRATAAGYIWNRVGENIAAGTGFTAAEHEDDLMIDSGQLGRGHRVNLLDIFSPTTAPYREIGIFWYAGASPVSVPNPTPPPASFSLQNFMTQDFGRRDTVGPFILGVVYNDTGATPNFYDPGEGLGGVQINTVDNSMVPTGTWQAVTGSAGGYSFPCSTIGTVNVKPTGGIAWAATVYRKVTLSGENVKVDFKQSDGIDTDGDGMPDAWEIAHGLNPNDPSDASGDLDGDTYSNVEEFRFGSNPQVAASTPLNPQGGAVPPPPPSNTGGGGGGCGLTGFEGCLLLALVRLRGRR